MILAADVNINSDTKLYLKKPEAIAVALKSRSLPKQQSQPL